MEPDFYSILGLARGASADEIKHSYRKLARENHPDHHPDDPAAEERFKQISEAYQVLSDPGRRDLYDRYGAAGIAPGFDPAHYERARSYGAGAGGFGGGFDGMDLGDLFGFSGGGRPGARPANISLRMEVDFERALAGFETSFQYQRRVRCGSCGGQGVTGAQPCSACGGRGLVSRQENVRVRVPEGADDGDVIRLRGRGHQGRRSGTPDADLLLELTVKPMPGVRREQLNLVVTCTIEPMQAVMGASVDVPLLDRVVKVRVPEGVRSGQRLRLKGQGVRRSGATGDAYVEVLIDGHGRKLTDTQRQAAAALWESMKS